MPQFERHPTWRSMRFFAALLWRAIHYGRNVRVGFRSEAVLISLVGILYAAADEFHQSFVTSRGSSVGDVMIDSGGILLTLFAVRVITRRRRREELIGLAEGGRSHASANAALSGIRCCHPIDILLDSRRSDQSHGNKTPYPDIIS